MSEYLQQPGSGKLATVDVVIPALNEAQTIGDVVSTFRQSPRIGKVIVVSDLSRDRTGPVAAKAGAVVVKGPGKGKGQAMMRGLLEVKSPRVIFADADINGLTVNHVNALAATDFGMIVGLRDTGRFNFIQVQAQLPPIAGERSLPTRFVRSLRLDGFGAETQINIAVAKNNMRTIHFIMKGVTGKLRAGPLRMIDVAPYLRPDLMRYGALVSWRRPVV